MEGGPSTTANTTEKVEDKKEETPKEESKPKTEDDIFSVDSKFFDDETAKDFTCSVCKSVPNPELAVEDSNCGGIFCKKCVDDLLKINGDDDDENEHKPCPNCKAQFKVRNIKKENKIIYRYLLKLNPKCPFGCDWKGNMEDYFNIHVKECKFLNHFCKFRNAGCNFTGSFDELTKHYEKKEYHLDIACKCVDRQKKVLDGTIFHRGQEYRVTVHPHPLIGIDRSGWGCDGRRRPEGCYSGLTEYETSGYERFRCDECDYDLCHACLQHYIIV